MQSLCAEDAMFLNVEEKPRPTDNATSCSHVKSKDGRGPRWKFWRRRRDILGILSFFGFVNVALLRNNLNIAIVAMTSDHPVLLANGTLIQERDFDWDSVSKGVVLSAFYYGYVVAQIPGGWLAIRFGGHRVYGLGVCITAFLTLITPVVAGVHIYLLVAIRVAEGLCEGLSFPSIEFLMARWTPMLERNRLGAMILSGVPLGSVVSMALSGYLASHVGWQSVFYVSSSLGAVWTLFWWTLISEDPSTDSRISAEESSHIIATRTFVLKMRQARGTIPWLSIVSSLPVWSTVFAAFVTALNFHILGTQMPAYLKETMEFDLTKTGFLSALPYLIASIVSTACAYLIDAALTKKLLSLTVVRKLSIGGCMLLNTFAILVLGYLTSASATVVCLVLCILLEGITSMSVTLNCLDLAPQYSGVIVGILHTVSALSGVIGPTLSGFIVPNKRAEEWRKLFGVAAGFSGVGALVYFVLGSGEIQPWSNNGNPSRQQVLPQDTTDARLRTISD